MFIKGGASSCACPAASRAEKRVAAQSRRGAPRYCLAMDDPLKKYKAKRNFAITPEPAEGGDQGEELKFVIQKHWATRLHYDFRLELDGTMKSWAVPRGPSYDQHDKRMAVHVEDHHRAP